MKQCSQDASYTLITPASGWGFTGSYFSTQILNVGVPHDSFVCPSFYKIFSQGSLACFIFKITGCGNYNLYLFQLCLLDLRLYLQNLVWLLLPPAFFQAIYFFFPSPTHRNQMLPLKNEIMFLSGCNFASYSPAEKVLKILKMTLRKLWTFWSAFLP